MRQLSAADARDMATIHAQSFAPPYGTGGWDALEMAAHTKKDRCFGLDKDSALAVFIIISQAADQAEILTLATATAARRKGLAARLLAEAQAELKSSGAAELFLEVAEDNDAAIALYRGAGFLPLGRRPGYYRRPNGRVAAITFSKKL